MTIPRLSTIVTLCSLTALAIGLVVASGPGRTANAAPTGVRLSAWYGTTCAITSLNAAVCWGWNAHGALGADIQDVHLGTSNRPVGVVGAASGIAGVTVGSGTGGAGYACFVSTSGGAKCWGNNSAGQLGDGSASNRTLPVGVQGLDSGVESIDAGGGLGPGHTCAQMSSGGVKCWGANSDGQLGNGTTIGSWVPVEVTGLTGVSGLVAGGHHTCALLSNSQVQCWGSNEHGQLGNGSTLNQTSPVTVCESSDCLTPLTGVVSLTAGEDHTCARLNTGTVKCWGENLYGQIGDGTQIDRTTPVSTLAGSATALDAGFYHTCVLLSSTKVQCWGYNQHGELGNGTSGNPSLVPVSVCATGASVPCGSNLLTGVSAVAGGYYHTCALMAAGGAKCWGDRSVGQLGDGITQMNNFALKPVDVKWDTDRDGCSDSQENGSNQALGGRRDRFNFWDFFDTPNPLTNIRDRVITQADIDRVSDRFGYEGNPAGDPLSKPSSTPSYHTAFDRSSPPPGGDSWDLGPANGTIDLFTDIFGSSGQSGHSCA